jgi:tripartite-type tricarboxylate transporter receptor subunit TctC
VAPPGLTAAVVDHWQHILRAALQTPTWQEYLERNSQTDTFLDANAFGQELAQQNAWFSRRLAQAGWLADGPGT